MRRLEVAVPGRAYPVLVGAGAAKEIGGFLSGQVLVVADPAAPRLLELDAPVVEVEGGEDAKTMAGVERLLDELERHRVGRDGTLVAVGGGTIGDLAGFAASIWQRGVAVVQVPTTLLAMVDSSIGGKTGVNTARAKNAVGSFWQPRAVLADTRYLDTLPPAETANGWAEVVKYAVTFEPGLAGVGDVAEVIERCARIKGRIVAADEREAGHEGGRILLNYGHTVGHALEAATGYRIPHGRAVAWGMRVAAELSVQTGMAAADLRTRQDALLAEHGLPGPRPEVDFEAVLDATRADKKVRGGRRTWVLLRDLGRPFTTSDVSDRVVAGALAEILGG